MGDKKKIDDDSVTVTGLPGHPENVGKSMSRRSEYIAREAEKDKENQRNEGASDPAQGSAVSPRTKADQQEPATERGGGSGTKDEGDHKATRTPEGPELVLCSDKTREKASCAFRPEAFSLARAITELRA